MSRAVITLAALAVTLCASSLAAKPVKPVRAPTIIRPVVDPAKPVPQTEGCPAPAQGGEAASDWRPPPIPPKEARGPVTPQGGTAASDWRPPPIPPREAMPAGQQPCTQPVSESADWRPPPIPPKR